jgi:branched-chain amino acid transport system permease protein
MAKWLGYGVLILLGVIAPFFVYEIFLIKLLSYGLFAVAFNMLLGYGGLMSFGHAAFFGTSAYLMAHMLKVWGLPSLLGLVLAALASGALGAVFGAIAIRRQGIYFAMITLALAQMVFFVFLQAPFTGGEDGLHGVPRGTLFGLLDLSSNLTMYYFVLAVFLLVFFFVRRMVYSPFGHLMSAIRQNEARAISLGYDVHRYKLLLFILSATVAGLAGALKTLAFQFVSLTDAHFHLSGEVVLMTLLGGVGTLFGPLFGAFMLVGLQNMLAEGAFRALVPVVLGVLFVVCVLFFRRGIVGELQHYLKRSL